MSRILTGERPTGKMHLGHYVGTLQNRVTLQKTYDCTFIIADLHMLTTKNSREDILASEASAIHMVQDQLSVGIDASKSKFYLQSGIPEIHELYTYLQSIPSVSRLQRIPSLKDMARDAHIEMNFALLGYPVLQSADILCVKADLVPVGRDNQAHVEIAREIAKKFNALYGKVFPTPRPLIGQEGSLIGIYGKEKMGKSANNAIFLSDDASTVNAKVKKMFTDPKRIRADIPGETENNPVFIYHRLFNPNTAEVDDLSTRYKAGKVSDAEVKEKLARALNNFLDPIRERREKFAKPGVVEELIFQGTQEVRREVQNTIAEVRKAMGFTPVWNSIQKKASKAQL